MFRGGKLRSWAVLVALIVALSLLFGCQPAEVEPEERQPITVGSKEFTEQLILGQLTLLALEDAGIEVKDETNLGGTLVVREAQELGDVDLYWEYTGTALITHLGHDEAITDSEECYQVVKEEDQERFGLVWLDYAPLNNTYTIMMRRDDAEELGIETISDLAAMINAGERPLEEWVFATDHEYSIRDDGYLGLCELYGFEFDDVITMDLGITYAALRDGEVPVAMGFATDGRIAGFDLVNLEDDLAFHPVYNVAPVVREEVLEQYPELTEILGPIAKALDNETMAGLNAAVDIEEREPCEVAREWLQEQGFIE